MLITGGAGFIGSHCIDRFADEFKVYVVDNFSSGKRSNIEGKNITLFESDISDTDLLIDIVRKNDISHVIHLAACISVVQSVSDPITAEKTNSLDLVSFLDKAGPLIECFILASSAAVYGESDVLPKIESMALDPLSPYAITKMSGEFYNRFFSKKHGYRPLNLRFFNVFGPRQDPESQYAAAVPIFFTKAISGNTITVYGDGNQTRDFVYVEDLVDSIAFLIKNKSSKFDTYNIGYGKSISVSSLIEKICSMTSSDSEISYVDERIGEIRHSYSSIDRLDSEGWTPKYGFEKGLQKTLFAFSEYCK